VTRARPKWPTIPGIAGRTVADGAVWLMLYFVGAKVAEGNVANRGDPWVDEFQRVAGLPVPEDASRPGFPWCTAMVFACFAESARQKSEANPFPHTARAVSVHDMAPPGTVIVNPVHGAVFVISHGKAWASELGTGRRLTDNGHLGLVVLIGGTWHTVSGNTNHAGSREGNAALMKPIPDGGGPESVHGGTLLSYHDFGLT
jgi:hypothetical protein